LGQLSRLLVAEAAKLDHPSLTGVSHHAVPRPRKVGSPPRLAKKFDGVFDTPMTRTGAELTPLTRGMTIGVRARLLRAIEEKAEEMAYNESLKRHEKENAPPPKHTEMIKYAPVALSVTHKRPSTAEAGHSDENFHPAANLGEAMIANVPKLAIVDSIPIAPSLPTKKLATTPAVVVTSGTDGKAAHAISGTEAAAGGRLATTVVAPLTVLKENDMSGLLSGLTAVSQMLPANTAARKLTELYAHFQRHLARSRDYFREQSLRVQKQREQARKESQEKRKREQAARGLIAPVEQVEYDPSSRVMARVDSEGFIDGPPRSAPTLEPSMLFNRDAKSSSSENAPNSPSSSGVGSSSSSTRQFTSKLYGRDGARRRGGGHLGMLESQTPDEMADSIRVLADMIAKETLENEQALRVLNSYDKKQLLYLPTALLKRAQELHELLDKRMEAEQHAKMELLSEAELMNDPLKQKLLKKRKDDSTDSKKQQDTSDSDEDDDPEHEEKHVSELRIRARKKAKAKFRLLPGVVDLFGVKSEAERAQEKRQQEEDAVRAAEMTPRLLETDAARRVINAVTAANTGRPMTGHSTRPNTSAGLVDHSHGEREAKLPIPPPFVSLYASYGLRPNPDGQLGFESVFKPSAAVMSGAEPGLSLLDIVRARANLERKLKQDEFVASTGAQLESEQFSSSLQVPQSLSRPSSVLGMPIALPAHHQLTPEQLAARNARLSELRGLQAEDAADRASISLWGGGGDASESSSNALDGSVSVAASGRRFSITSGFAAPFTPSAIAGDLKFNLPPAHLQELEQEGADDDDLDVDAMLARMASQRQAATAAGTYQSRMLSAADFASDDSEPTSRSSTPTHGNPAKPAAAETTSTTAK
jgi:hypothetical protein